MEEAIEVKKEKMVPELRFSEFEGDWKIRNLSSYLKERISYADKSLPLFSLTIEKGIIPKTERYERSFLVKGEKNAYKIMKPGDFAYNPMNLRFGALARYNGNSEIAVSKYYNIFYVTDKGIGAYFEAYLTTYKMIQFYEKMSTGSLLEKKRVHYLDFIHFKKPIPEPREQQKIASFLSAVDKKIQQLTRKKELLEKYKKGVMQKIFPPAGGQVPGIRFKKDDGGEFPEWEEKKLGDIADFSKGKTISKSDLTEHGTIKCIHYGELYTHYAEVIEEIKSATSLDDKLLTLSEVNDLLIPSSGETNVDIARVSCILKKGIALGGDINILKTSENGVFLAYYLSSAKKFDIAKLAQGNSIVHLYNKQLKSLHIDIPYKEEQLKIANFLRNIDAKINAVDVQQKKMQQFKKGLLQQMFV